MKLDEINLDRKFFKRFLLSDVTVENPIWLKGAKLGNIAQNLKIEGT